MKKNIIRIAIGTVFGIALLSVLLGLLKERTPLICTAYGWSVGALLVFAVALGFWAAGNGTKYILNAAFPRLAGAYLALTLLIAAGFGVLAYLGIFTLGTGWFVLIELAVLAFFVWRALALDAGRDAIIATENNVQAATVDWKLLVVEIDAIAERCAAADRAAVVKSRDAVRYADPVAHPAVFDLAGRIRDRIAELGAAVDAADSAAIAKLCPEIERAVRERADKLKVVK